MQKAAKETCRAAETPLPQELDLLPLLRQSPRLRADLLFYTRLAGTYCQTIFWQAFALSAKIRRKFLFETAKATITGKSFKEAILNPQKRAAQSTDILHSGFVKLLKQLQQQPRPEPAINQGQTDSINDSFSKGLRERHGLPWDMAEFIAAIEILVKQRGFLEHFDERLKDNAKGEQGHIPTLQENAKFIHALGLLLLPQFCNEVENTLRRIKDASGSKIGAETAETIAAIFTDAKQKRAEGIKMMFAEARARKNMHKGQEKTKNGKHKNKKQISRALLSGAWRKYYYGLKLSPTDFRENTFKRYYDFIGEQNFKQIYTLLGADLDSSKLKNFDMDNPQKGDYFIYASDTTRPSFRYEIALFYICVMRLQLLLHFYLGYAPKGKKDKITDPILKEIRDTIAHNGLFWRVKNPDESVEFLPVKAVFRAIMHMLKTEHMSGSNIPPYTEFYDSAYMLLQQENCPIWHMKTAENEPPQTRKISKQILTHKLQLRKSLKKQAKHREERKLLRARLTIWIKQLQKANHKLE